MGKFILKRYGMSDIIKNIMYLYNIIKNQLMQNIVITVSTINIIT